MPDSIQLEEQISEVNKTIPLTSNRGKLVMTNTKLVLIQTKPEYLMKTVNKQDVSLGHIHQKEPDTEVGDVDKTQTDTELRIYISNKSINMDFDIEPEELSEVWISEMVNIEP